MQAVMVLSLVVVALVSVSVVILAYSRKLPAPIGPIRFYKKRKLVRRKDIETWLMTNCISK